ncbi:sialate O-acetylesterase [Oleiharenicola lentus]|uniref:sialate O-acetylesterase n=1 Tax=Oleiharenicola lentus TaxID=2508720 RepID=UPI003F67BF38
MKVRSIFRGAAIVLLSVQGLADVKLAPLFADHAVLQRRMDVPVWGRADAGEAVTVKFREHSVKTVADTSGRWRVTFPPLEAGAPTELVVSGKNVVRLIDVVVGEVWLCGGQSNMAFRVEEMERPDVIAEATNDQIRHFAVGFAAAATPSETAAGSWKICSPATVAKFTASGYFFARDLQARLGVPIGLVNSSVGGTQIESWMSAESLASNPAFAMVNERWAAVMGDYPRLQQDYEAALAWWEQASGRQRLESAKQNRRKPLPPRSSAHRDAPASLFNAMIHPLVPYALRGMIFDQGAANATRTDEYGALFRAMITDWRARWGDAEQPFYFIQARNYRDPLSPGDNRAKLREAQASALALPATGMAVTIDIGASDDPHPRNKAEEGGRLARLALAKTYGEDVTFSGPVFRGLKKAGGALRVEFETFGHELAARANPLEGFEIAAADGNYFPASVRIEGRSVVVASKEVVAPVAVRYAWGDDPACDLESDAKLPTAPFRAEILR